MAKNDIILLDGILQQRVADGLPSHAIDEVFEYLGFEQALKDFDLSREELESGWVDGRDDGGIDAFYTIVNGHLLRDPDTFAWPKRSATLDVVIITAKHHATFQQAPLNNLLATLPQIFDLARDKSALRGAYSDDVLKARSLFQIAYTRLAAITPSLTFRLIYASRGDSTEVGGSITARAAQIVDVVQSLFSSSRASFEFLGAAELVTLYRRTKSFSLALPFVEYLSRSGDSYVLLTKIADYAKFATDETGHLRRYLFDSNVRDYLGDNRVNEDIGMSLGDDKGPEFWWLNNGVTILATGATVLGKVIQLQDVQIVNGLQTTESIFNHVTTGRTESRDKGLLVKVVVSTDTSVRDQIIRATNNQSLVEPQSLHATDKIQRDIEEILERHGWFYERRKNYYRNVGKPVARFVTPMYIAAGFVALVMRNPVIAAALKSKFMRDPVSYEMVFSERDPIEVWPVIVEVLKRSEDALEGMRPRGAKGERFLARSRNLLGLLGVARVLGTFNYRVDQLVTFDPLTLTSDLLREMWGVVQSVDGPQPHDRVRGLRYYPKAQLACERAAELFSISGVEVVARRRFPPRIATPAPVSPSRDITAQGQARPTSLDSEFVNEVDRLLPPQPWKPGVHAQLAGELKKPKSWIAAAIAELVRTGRRLQQRDGVVYNTDGTVAAIDLNRVKSTSTAENDIERR